MLAAGLDQDHLEQLSQLAAHLIMYLPSKLCMEALVLDLLVVRARRVILLALLMAAAAADMSQNLAVATPVGFLVAAVEVMLPTQHQIMLESA
jgi:hypothetical protein